MLRRCVRPRRLHGAAAAAAAASCCVLCDTPGHGHRHCSSSSSSGNCCAIGGVTSVRRYVYQPPGSAEPSLPWYTRNEPQTVQQQPQQPQHGASVVAGVVGAHAVAPPPHAHASATQTTAAAAAAPVSPPSAAARTTGDVAAAAAGDADAQPHATPPTRRQQQQHSSSARSAQAITLDTRIDYVLRDDDDDASSSTEWLPDVVRLLIDTTTTSSSSSSATAAADADGGAAVERVTMRDFARMQPRRQLFALGGRKAWLAWLLTTPHYARAARASGESVGVDVHALRLAGVHTLEQWVARAHVVRVSPRTRSALDAAVAVTVHAHVQHVTHVVATSALHAPALHAWAADVVGQFVLNALRVSHEAASAARHAQRARVGGGRGTTRPTAAAAAAGRVGGDISSEAATLALLSPSPSSSNTRTAAASSSSPSASLLPPGECCTLEHYHRFVQKVMSGVRQDDDSRTVTAATTANTTTTTTRVAAVCAADMQAEAALRERAYALIASALTRLLEHEVNAAATTATTTTTTSAAAQQPLLPAPLRALCAQGYIAFDRVATLLQCAVSCLQLRQLPVRGFVLHSTADSVHASEVAHNNSNAHATTTAATAAAAAATTLMTATLDESACAYAPGTFLTGHRAVDVTLGAWAGRPLPPSSNDAQTQHDVAQCAYAAMLHRMRRHVDRLAATSLRELLCDAERYGYGGSSSSSSGGGDGQPFSVATALGLHHTLGPARRVEDSLASVLAHRAAAASASSLAMQPLHLVEAGAAGGKTALLERLLVQQQYNDDDDDEGEGNVYDAYGMTHMNATMTATTTMSTPRSSSLASPPPPPPARPRRALMVRYNSAATPFVADLDDHPLALAPRLWFRVALACGSWLLRSELLYARAPRVAAWWAHAHNWSWSRVHDMLTRLQQQQQQQQQQGDSNNNNGGSGGGVVAAAAALRCVLVDDLDRALDAMEAKWGKLCIAPAASASAAAAWSDDGGSDAVQMRAHAEATMLLRDAIDDDVEDDDDDESSGSSNGGGSAAVASGTSSPTTTTAAAATTSDADGHRGARRRRRHAQARAVVATAQWAYDAQQQWCATTTLSVDEAIARAFAGVAAALGHVTLIGSATHVSALLLSHAPMPCRRYVVPVVAGAAGLTQRLRVLPLLATLHALHVHARLEMPGVLYEVLKVSPGVAAQTLQMLWTGQAARMNLHLHTTRLVRCGAAAAAAGGDDGDVVVQRSISSGSADDKVVMTTGAASAASHTTTTSTTLPAIAPQAHLLLHSYDAHALYAEWPLRNKLLPPLPYAQQQQQHHARWVRWRVVTLLQRQLCSATGYLTLGLDATWQDVRMGIVTTHNHALAQVHPFALFLVFSQQQQQQQGQQQQEEEEDSSQHAHAHDDVAREHVGAQQQQQQQAGAKKRKLTASSSPLAAQHDDKHNNNDNNNNNTDGGVGVCRESPVVQAWAEVWAEYCATVNVLATTVARKRAALRVLLHGALMLRAAAVTGAVPLASSPSTQQQQQQRGMRVPPYGFPLLASDVRVRSSSSSSGSSIGGDVRAATIDTVRRATTAYKAFFAHATHSHYAFRPLRGLNAGCDVVYMAGTTMTLYDTVVTAHELHAEVLVRRVAEALLGVLHALERQVLPAHQVRVLHHVTIVTIDYTSSLLSSSSSLRAREVRYSSTWQSAMRGATADGNEAQAQQQQQQPYAPMQGLLSSSSSSIGDVWAVSSAAADDDNNDNNHALRSCAHAHALPVTPYVLDYHAVFSDRILDELRRLRDVLGMPRVFRTLHDLVDALARGHGVRVRQDIVSAHDELEALLSPTLLQLVPDATVLPPYTTAMLSTEALMLEAIRAANAEDDEDEDEDDSNNNNSDVDDNDERTSGHMDADKHNNNSHANGGSSSTRRFARGEAAAGVDAIGDAPLLVAPGTATAMQQHSYSNTQRLHSLLASQQQQLRADRSGSAASLFASDAQLRESAALLDVMMNDDDDDDDGSSVNVTPHHAHAATTTAPAAATTTTMTSMQPSHNATVERAAAVTSNNNSASAAAPPQQQRRVAAASATDAEGDALAWLHDIITPDTLLAGNTHAAAAASMGNDNTTTPTSAQQQQPAAAVGSATQSAAVAVAHEQGATAEHSHGDAAVDDSEDADEESDDDDDDEEEESDEEEDNDNDDNKTTMAAQPEQTNNNNSNNSGSGDDTATLFPRTAATRQRRNARQQPAATTTTAAAASPAASRNKRSASRRRSAATSTHASAAAAATAIPHARRSTHAHATHNNNNTKKAHALERILTAAIRKRRGAAAPTTTTTSAAAARNKRKRGK